MHTIMIDGTCASARVFTTDQHPLDQYATAQVKMICDNAAAAGSTIRIMPDVHPGKVGPIGLTMTVRDRVLPSLVSTKNLRKGE